MILAEGLDCVQIEGVAQSMSHHDCPSLRPHGLAEHLRNRVVRSEFNVDDDGLQAILQNRIDRCGETHRDREYFVTGLQRTLPKFGTGECA